MANSIQSSEKCNASTEWSDDVWYKLGYHFLTTYQRPYAYSANDVVHNKYIDFRN